MCKTGHIPPTMGDWDTMYFLPGVHDIGPCFRVHANKKYYIPGDALVHGTFNNNKVGKDGHHIKIYGYGTLSGERIPHSYDIPTAQEKDYLEI